MLGCHFYHRTGGVRSAQSLVEDLKEVNSLGNQGMNGLLTLNRILGTKSER
jgi:hypothetical protein